MTWKQHCNKIFKKINSNIALLRRIKQFLPLNIRKLFYNSYILPHLDYCCHLWGASPFMKRLYKIQKRAIRVICDARYNASTEDLFKSMYIMPLPDRIFYKNICMVFKCLNNLAPQYMDSLFTIINHRRVTRSTAQNLLEIPMTNKDFYRRGFTVNGAKQWNSVNLNIRSSNSFGSFKTSYLKDYWNNLTF